MEDPEQDSGRKEERSWEIQGNRLCPGIVRRTKNQKIVNESSQRRKFARGGVMSGSNLRSFAWKRKPCASVRP
jgi:hypothetical protein